MSGTVRRAEVVWQGDLLKGKGQVTARSSVAFEGLPVTWASRAEKPDGRTSPEELLAAAHAACYAMALSFALGQGGTPPERLDVSAEVTFEQDAGGFKIGASRLTVRATVPGIDAAKFQEIATATKDACPVSKALAGNVALSVQATLVG